MALPSGVNSSTPLLHEAARGIAIVRISLPVTASRTERVKLCLNTSVRRSGENLPASTPPKFSAKSTRPEARSKARGGPLSLVNEGHLAVGRDVHGGHADSVPKATRPEAQRAAGRQRIVPLCDLAL